MAQCDAKPCGPSGEPLDNVDTRIVTGAVGGLILDTPAGAGAGAAPVPIPFDDSDRYRMDHKRRGKFIIINNRTFQPGTGMGERSGTDVDASGLYQLFKNFRFDVRLEHNRTTFQMKEIMEKAGSEDHTDADCFGAAFLSHGDEGVIFGVDGVISIDALLAPIKKCKSLAGKPKLFFFQACRGTSLDGGVEAQCDADLDKETVRIPLEADFLYAYSTVPGYFSWRNSSKGSWFVQALCAKMTEISKSGKSEELDLVRILTRVSRKVAYDFESNASQQHMNKKKQVPSIVSMLTKELYLTTK